MEIQIPKSRDLVTIGGYVNLDEAYSQGYLTGERNISVAFRGEKSAKYYVDKFAAGVSKDGTTSQIGSDVQMAESRILQNSCSSTTTPMSRRGLM